MMQTSFPPGVRSKSIGDPITATRVGVGIEESFGRIGCRVVVFLTFHSDGPSSNRCDIYSFSM